jgi:hypothetical protein
MQLFIQPIRRAAFAAMIPAAAIFAAGGLAQPALASDVVFAAGTGVEAHAPSRSPAASGEALEKAAAQMADPAFQDGLSGMAEGLGEALLSLPIGKFVHAVEQARPETIRKADGKTMREDATLADVAGEDAGELPAQMGKQSRAALTAMSSLASAFASMMPALEKLGRDIQKSAGKIKTARP